MSPPGHERTAAAACVFREDSGRGGGGGGDLCLVVGVGVGDGVGVGVSGVLLFSLLDPCQVPQVWLLYEI